MALLAAAFVTSTLPAPANAATGFDTITPIPGYAWMDTREAAWPWADADYTPLDPTSPTVQDLTSKAAYCGTKPMPIGFNFPYYGKTYDMMQVNGQGFIQLEGPKDCKESAYIGCGNFYSPKPYYYGSGKAACSDDPKSYDYYYDSKYSDPDPSTWTDGSYGGEYYYYSSYPGPPPSVYEYQYCYGGYAPYWPSPPPVKDKPNAIIGVWGGFMAPTCFGADMGSRIYTTLEGEVGQRVRIVEFKDMIPSTYASTYKSNFQVRIYEEDGHMEIAMKALDMRSSWSVFLGIETAKGDKGHRYALPSYSLLTNRGVAYYPTPQVKLLTLPDKACINMPFNIVPEVKAAKTLGRVIGYKWTFEDGSTSTLPIPEKVFYERGNYSIKVELTFEVGIKFPSSGTVRVFNCIPPVARFDVSTDDMVGATPTDRSYDPDGKVVGWRWQFGDGSDLLTGQDPGRHQYEAAETFWITLEVVDSEGFTDSTTRAVTTHGKPMVLSPGLIAASGSDQTREPGELVTLDGRGGDAWRATRFYWEQTAGRPVVLDDLLTATPSFVAPDLLGVDAEEYAFSLRLYDGHHLSVPDEVLVKVLPPTGRPVADAGEDLGAVVGAEVALDGSKSADPEEGDLTYSWKQVDGTPVELIGAKTATPSFTAPPVGEASDLVFSLVVSDGKHTSAPALVQVNVQPPMQVSEVGFRHENLYALQPGLMEFHAPASGEPVAYMWDFGDGAKGAGPMVPHVFAKDGEYLVKMDVVDSAGNVLKSHEQTVQVYMPDRSVPEETAVEGGASAPAPAGVVLLLALGALALAMRRRQA